MWSLRLIDEWKSWAGAQVSRYNNGNSGVSLIVVSPLCRNSLIWWRKQAMKTMSKINNNNINSTPPSSSRDTTAPPSSTSLLSSSSYQVQQGRYSIYFLSWQTTTVYIGPDLIVWFSILLSYFISREDWLFSLFYHNLEPNLKYQHSLGQILATIYFYFLFGFFVLTVENILLPIFQLYSQ